MDKIILKKPDIAPLKKEGYMCFDMHVHSEYSSDCDSKVKDIIKRAEELGIGIAITDHNEIAGSLEAYKLNKNIVIPGTEVRSKEGLDILFYFFKIEDLIDFYKKFVEPNKKKISATKLSAVELIKKSNNYKVVSCIAHPYRPSLKKRINFLINKEKIKSVFNKVKAFEVINSKNFRVSNNMAIRSAIKKNKFIIGGSDSHIIKTIGGTVTRLKKKKKETHILDGILLEDVMVIGKERNLIFAIIEALFIFIKKKVLK